MPRRSRCAGLFRRSRIIGRRFQIVHVMQGGETLEVSTFRAAHDAHTVKDEHGRVLRDNVFGSIAEDAARRDFTVNALYYDPATETVIDYHHGVADLQQKTLRMIGEPRLRYREDPVRMLRAVRLSAKLRLTLDPAVRAPIREMAELMENVPAARLFDEMLKLLFSGHAVECVKRLRDDGSAPWLAAPARRDPRTAAGREIRHAGPDPAPMRASTPASRCRPAISSPPCCGTRCWRQLGSAQGQGRGAHPRALRRDGRSARGPGRKARHHPPHRGDIKDIWALQPRFDKRAGKSPHRLIEHCRAFAPAMTFWRCAPKAARFRSELADWWHEFQNADHAEREAMLMPDSRPEKKRRRAQESSVQWRPRCRRRRRSAPATGMTSERALLRGARRQSWRSGRHRKRPSRRCATCRVANSSRRRRCTARAGRIEAPTGLHQRRGQTGRRVASADSSRPCSPSRLASVASAACAMHRGLSISTSCCTATSSVPIRC
jgi:poly(A) polymerase